MFQLEFFDGLYADITSSHDPHAGILIWHESTNPCVVFLLPRAEVPEDLNRWVWRVLREGFRWNDESGPAVRSAPGVWRFGPR